MCYAHWFTWFSRTLSWPIFVRAGRRAGASVCLPTGRVDLRCLDFDSFADLWGLAYPSRVRNGSGGKSQLTGF